MHGILTPEEIQDLLHAPVAAGPIAQLWTGEAVPFDLLQAGSQSQARLPQVQALQAGLPDALATAWSGVLKRKFTATAGEYALLPMSDALAQIAADTQFAIHWRDVQTPLDGLLCVDRAMVYSLFATQFGGGDGGVRTLPLTRLELNFLHTLIEPVSQQFTAAWRDKGVAPLAIEAVLEQQEAIAALGWSNECYRVTMSVSEGESAVGNLTWMIPADICALLDGDGAKPTSVASAGARSSVSWPVAAAWALEEVSLPVQVEMGVYPTRIRAVLQLQPGDIIEPMLHTEYPVTVRGYPIFSATMGELDGHRAVQIVATQPV